MNVVTKTKSPTSALTHAAPCVAIFVGGMLLLLLAGTIVLALIPLYLQPKSIDNVDRTRSTIYLTVNYGTNMTNSSSMTVSQLDNVAANLMKSYQLTGISLNSAKFVQGTISVRKRATNSFVCDTDPGTNGDLLTTSMAVECGSGCISDSCRAACLKKVQSRIIDDHPHFTIPMEFTDESTYQIYLSCCSVGAMSFTESSSLQSHINTLLRELRSQTLDAMLYWNLVSIHAGANDFDATVTKPPNQAGPLATARAYAIIHGAMYDAFVAFNPEYQSLFKTTNLPSIDGVSKEDGTNAAIMEAAYQTLSNLFPKQKEIFDAARNEHLRQMRNASATENAIERGITVGQAVATFIIAKRSNDGSKVTKSYTPIPSPGFHRVDPLHPQQGFLGYAWPNVTPMVIKSASEFRASSIVGITPEERLVFLNSSKYRQDYDEVKSIGAKMSSTRTADQEEMGIFWAYDGAPKIGTPPRLYSQIVQLISMQQKNTLAQNARLLAMTHIAMFDVTIACWETKYVYNTWRPIVAIRATSDPNWEPLGAPSDGVGSDFTPNFPSYNSGHAVFGSSVFEILRLFYGTDNIAFELSSDEYNGKTIDSRTQQARPVRKRKFSSFTQAETENTLARIYLGIHWRIDQEEAELQGRRVGEYVFKNFP